MGRTRPAEGFNAPAVPSFAPPISDLDCDRDAALEGVNQVLGMEFELLQPHFFELFIDGKVRLLNQLFQPLSVATVFGVQAVNLFAQRSVLNFIHRRPPWFHRTFTYSSGATQSASGKQGRLDRSCGFSQVV